MRGQVRPNSDRNAVATSTVRTERFDAETIRILGVREQHRDDYWLRRDPITSDRLLWRAQTFRHLVHTLPGQTVLELGAGHGLFTQQLVRVTRGRNPITSVTFQSDRSSPKHLPANVEFRKLGALPGALAGRQFDFVVGMDLLDQRNCAWLLQQVIALLKPGGQVVFYESNPWNLVLQLRRTVAVRFGRADPRRLLDRPALYELISEVGFIRIFAAYNDFVFAPLTPALVWWLRNLSILLENMPFIRTLAGSILLHAQKPPRLVEQLPVSLFEHESLRRRVSVVVPCHNEEMNVAALVERLQAFYGEYIKEIVLVDDNSSDETGQIIRELARVDPTITPVFRTPPNGVGRALADGYRAASGDYILSMDCDFQHLLPEFRDLFDGASRGYDVVIGSRFSRHSVLLNYPFQKVLANRGFHLLANMLFRRGPRRGFRDLTNNLKLMRREVLEQLDLTQPGFAINAETGLQPVLLGYSVLEVPISWINRRPDMGVSSFKLAQVGSGYCQVLLRLWFQSLSKRGAGAKQGEGVE